MTRWRYDGQPVSNGWTAPDNLGAFGIDYIHRAGMMYAGPYDGLRTEVKYYWTDNDTELNQLNGNSLYAVIFSKGQLPPVKGFWSLTMYDRQHLFYANDLDRYSLGTKNSKTLKYEPDGGLTLYLGNKLPGKDKEKPTGYQHPLVSFLCGCALIGRSGHARRHLETSRNQQNPVS